jgi:hypothetical protein
MPYRLLADAVVILHLGFVAFVLLGGLLVLRWPRFAWAHVPAAAWGALVEFSGWICPLTPLERWLRARDAGSAYHDDFVGQYVLPVLYPDWLTRPTQFVLGAMVVVLNLAIYGWLLARRRGRKRAS